MSKKSKKYQKFEFARNSGKGVPRAVSTCAVEGGWRISRFSAQNNPLPCHSLQKMPIVLADCVSGNANRRPDDKPHQNG
jgi:hypothetical protein